MWCRESLWQSLAVVKCGLPAKILHLKRARRSGLAIPEPTYWAWAAELEKRPPPVGLPDGFPLPCIVRSAAPNEDTDATSNAGRFHSEKVERPDEAADVFRRVLESLPVMAGRRRGAVLIQPFLKGAARASRPSTGSTSRKPPRRARTRA